MGEEVNNNPIKVYCSNCRYHHRKETWDRYIHICIIKTKKFEEDYNYLRKIKKRIIETRDCEILNRDNSCIVYRRKWWKFWIKPKRRYATKLEQVMHDIINNIPRRILWTIKSIKK
jgi:hypothetical protein